ncbi:Methyl-accepting chemotaxis protein PctC [Ferriphaselus amnicola]|uniref:Methyl-accepting chemotaxis protein PctC n=1 Tax=Ferriphaselus amnicola TaxID=1188319 RepID=A0A2Z6GF94_9PROT|nr:methyl-accepting chemotaxis protein [Ferriphaselus amnicola]BBE52049.1 Methyl-accepting chemotaxis protein PctC [Ferriphaselus amnicola]
MAIKLPSAGSELLKRGAGQAAGLFGDFAIPLIGNLPAARQLRLLGSTLLWVLAFTLLMVFMDNRAATHGARYIEGSGKLLMLSQRLSNQSELALSGDVEGFDGLSVARDQFAATLDLLDKGGEGLPATSGAARAPLDALLVTGKKTLVDAQALLDGRTGLVTVGRAVSQLEAESPAMRDAVEQLVSRADGGNKDRAVRFTILTERVAKGAAALQAPNVTTEMVAQLGIDTIEAEDLMATFPSTPLTEKVRDLFATYQVSVEALVSQAQALETSKTSGRALVTDSDKLLEQAEVLDSAYQGGLSGRLTSYLLALSAVALVVTLLLLGKVYLDDSRRRAADAEASNKRSQNAVLRLMNELSDLADGDLTIHATVSEEITGAIADTVNYTVDELRQLVQRITDTAEQVAQATQEAEPITRRLLDAAKKQSDEIQMAGEAVELITKSIQEVDSSAAQSADVARRTQEVTTQGSQAVQNSIAGMDSIREQIQETSKRIKRLGESSQQIGEIVDLISDITEQTNVLALNAAIQAASAGEAGRGFSVVAEEVQRLAERSADATKQIGVIVKTIQGDTQEAVAAMEKSTQGVVEGAKLSDEAGKVLKEIETATQELSDLVSSISVSTQVQTDMVQEVAQAMTDILKITEQTTEGTETTAAQVGQLATLATDLRSSVSGFRL